MYGCLLLYEPQCQREKEKGLQVGLKGLCGTHCWEILFLCALSKHSLVDVLLIQYWTSISET